MATADNSPEPFDPSSDTIYAPIHEPRVAYVEIFPAIGVARMGNSGSDPATGQRSGNPISYFLGPEVPGAASTPEGGFRDGRQAIKRQVILRFSLEESLGSAEY